MTSSPVVSAIPRVEFKNILFATDFSLCSDRALPWALALARRYGGKVHLVHALTPKVRYSVPLDDFGQLMERDHWEALEHLTQMEKTGQLSQCPHEVVLQHGELWEVISEVCRSADVDLIVLGTHGRTGISKLLLGSAAEKIFREASCPVLTVGPDVTAKNSLVQLKQIVYATDFSAAARQALPYALSLAQEHEAGLTIVHAVEGPLEVQIEASVNSTLSFWEKQVKEAISEVQGHQEPKVVARFGIPSEVILEEAGKAAADLIVMGVHTSASVETTIHMPWATAHEVVSHAHCPVLTVKGSAN